MASAPKESTSTSASPDNRNSHPRSAGAVPAEAFATPAAPTTRAGTVPTTPSGRTSILPFRSKRSRQPTPDLGAVELTAAADDSAELNNAFEGPPRATPSPSSATVAPAGAALLEGQADEEDQCRGPANVGRRREPLAKVKVELETDTELGDKDPSSAAPAPSGCGGEVDRAWLPGMFFVKAEREAPEPGHGGSKRTAAEMAEPLPPLLLK
mmetsp:Transcript_577/g.1811  ORF Transcript_577/g.1811 Transcript_577/m.1811 type:complete len:211 (+) Transcript_577:96-728(+)